MSELSAWIDVVLGWRPLLLLFAAGAGLGLCAGAAYALLRRRA